MNVIFQLESFIFIQILAPNADAEGQHPDLTGFASLRQDWHIKKCESESESEKKGCW